MTPVSGSARTRVRAAGGVVWRPVADGTSDGVEIAVVHRGRYDDWSLPKGKLDKGESEFAAAVREVGEEIGSTVTVSQWITRTAYRYGDADRGHVDKTVAYWSMLHTGGEFVASDEVDEVRWLDPADAAALVDHDVERDVLTKWDALPAPDAAVLLVRHAKAGKRVDWQGDDTLRPLDRPGVAQAGRLVDFLTRFAPDRVVSAHPVRCVQTVTPFADAAGLTVVVDPVFSDDGGSSARDALLALAAPGSTSVVCSQGGTIPALVDSLTRDLPPADAKKGSVWALFLRDGGVVQADYYSHPG